jgi:hypothetical protein
VNIGNDFVAANYTVRGTIRGRGDNPRVAFVIRLSGEDVIAGVNTPFRITLVYNLTVAPDTGTLEGVVHGSARFARLGSARINTAVSIPLAGTADGAWTLQMNIVPLNRLAGTATIVFSNNRVLVLNLGGHFSPLLNSSTVRVSGFADSRGNSLVVIFDTDVLIVHGRVLGQIVDAVIPQQPPGGG